MATCIILPLQMQKERDSLREEKESLSSVREQSEAANIEHRAAIQQRDMLVCAVNDCIFTLHDWLS